MEPNAPENQTPPTNPEPETSPVAAQPEAPTAPPMSETQPVTEQSPPATPTAAWLPLPTSWPGAFGIYKYSKQAVKLNVWVIIGWWFLISIVVSILGHHHGPIGQLIGDIIGVLGTAIGVHLYISGMRKQKVGFGDAFKEGIKLWPKMVLLNFLVAWTVVLSLLALIVPFFFIAPRMALANYFLVDKNMGVLEAYKASWHATKGNVSKVYGIVGANFAMALLVVTIIGIPFAIYFLIMYSAAFAVLYELVNTQATSTAVPPTAAPISTNS